MHRTFYVVLLFFVGMGCAGESHPGEQPREEILVFAAASLTDVLETLADSFETVHPQYRVVLNVAATSLLARQIEQSGRLGRVACAFLEEPPALDAVLAGIPETRIVVAGCFAEEGQHACQDVPDLIARSGRRALYLGPIAAAPWSDALILDSAANGARSTLAPSAAFEEQGLWQSPS